MTQCNAVFGVIKLYYSRPGFSEYQEPCANTSDMMRPGQHSWSGDCVRRAGSWEDANKVSDDLLWAEKNDQFIGLLTLALNS